MRFPKQHGVFSFSSTTTMLHTCIYMNFNLASLYVIYYERYMYTTRILQEKYANLCPFSMGVHCRAVKILRVDGILINHVHGKGLSVSERLTFYHKIQVIDMNCHSSMHPSSQMLRHQITRLARHPSHHTSHVHLSSLSTDVGKGLIFHYQLA